MHKPFGLGFGNLVKQLADEGAGGEVEAAHEFVAADELGGEDAGAVADVAGEKLADGGGVLFPGTDGDSLLFKGAEGWATGGDVVGEGEEGDGNAGWAEIDEVATDGAGGDGRTILTQLAGAHVMVGDLLDEAVVVGAGTEAFHDVLDEWDAHLGMAVKVNMAVVVGGVGGRFADVVQEGGKFHGR